LVHIIPTIYLTASENSTIYVVSPWVNLDLELILPRGLDKLDITLNVRTITFLEFIKKMRELRGVKTVFLMKKDKNNEKTIEVLRKENFEVHFYDNIHVKAVISDKLIYTGSANLTKSGILSNIENCELRYASKRPEEFLREIVFKDL